MTDKITLGKNAPFVIDGRHGSESHITTSGNNPVIIFLGVIPQGSKLDLKIEGKELTLSFEKEGKTQNFTFSDKAHISALVLSDGLIEKDGVTYFSQRAQINLKDQNISKLEGVIKQGFSIQLEQFHAKKYNQACAIEPYNLPIAPTNKLELI
jgi:hypothetical protein